VGSKVRMMPLSGSQNSLTTCALV